MAGLKEIKRRLKSVRNTKKITYAMKLVSAAKLRKAQEAAQSAREYTLEINKLLALVSQGLDLSTFSHPLLQERSSLTKVRLVVVGGQRGLCGGYNSNINKKTEAAFSELRTTAPGAEVSSVLVGRKPSEYFRRKGRSYEVSYEDLPENANKWPIEEICSNLEIGYKSGEFDQAWIIYTRFKSAISQQAVLEKLLPLDPRSVLEEIQKAQKETDISASSSVLFEPSPEEVLAALIPRILSSRIRLACLDAKASETASRMTAMDAATKNAGQLVRKLELTHNKIRQLKITAELLDIIGGAEAIKSE